MYDEYHKTEEDIQAVIRYLQIHDPKNASREYAVQFIDSMEGFGNEIARSDEALAEALRKATEKKDKRN